jgi:hypothetical protein
MARTRPDLGAQGSPTAVSLCSHAMSDPFAEEPIPWWRRFVHDDRRTYAPRSATFAIGFVAGLVALTLPSHHSLATGVLAAAATVAPAGLVETWYRQRHRREEEQLFVLPEAPQIVTKIDAR